MVVLRDALGLNFVRESGMEFVERLAFFGADEGFGGGESGGGGVLGGGEFACLGAGSGGELGVGVVGDDLSGGGHFVGCPFGVLGLGKGARRLVSSRFY